jgi:hypothetical protein
MFSLVGNVWDSREHMGWSETYGIVGNVWDSREHMGWSGTYSRNVWDSRETLKSTGDRLGFSRHMKRPKRLIVSNTRFYNTLHVFNLPLIHHFVSVNSNTYRRSLSRLGYN